eukprot:364223-Chlamydomonas_euryale.AAC.2
MGFTGTVARAVESTPDKVHSPHIHDAERTLCPCAACQITCMQHAPRMWPTTSASAQHACRPALHVQNAALTNLVYISASDEMAACSFVEMGGL